MRMRNTILGVDPGLARVIKNINDKLKELLTSNSIIPLKSGQQPPMYAKLHWTNWLKKLIPFTENNILDEFTENRLRKSDNTEYKVVQKYMKSLKEMNKPLYEAYDENEINMYIPNVRTAEEICTKMATLQDVSY